MKKFFEKVKDNFLMVLGIILGVGIFIVIPILGLVWPLIKNIDPIKEMGNGSILWGIILLVFTAIGGCVLIFSVICGFIHICGQLEKSFNLSYTGFVVIIIVAMLGIAALSITAKDGIENRIYDEAYEKGYEDGADYRNYAQGYEDGYIDGMLLGE